MIQEREMESLVLDVPESTEGPLVRLWIWLKNTSRIVRRRLKAAWNRFLDILPDKLVVSLIFAAHVFGWWMAFTIFMLSIQLAAYYGFFTFVGVVLFWSVVIGYFIQRSVSASHVKYA